MRAADAICSKDISKCYVNGGSKTCDREDATCAPCLEKMDGGFFDFLNPKYACHELDDDGKCPSGSSDCSVGAFLRLVSRSFTVRLYRRVTLTLVSLSVRCSYVD